MSNSNLRKNELLQSINTQLSRLVAEVEIKNSVNLFDVNHLSEDFYKGLLNNIYSYKLDNMNILENNTAAIDLGDKINRIAIQVTSETSSTKVKKTVKAFKEKGLYSDYNVLKMLYLKKKHSYKVKFETDNKFDLEHVDYTDIAKHLRGLETTRLEEISNYIEKEFNVRFPKKECNEVITIVSLIDYISNSTNDLTQDFEIEPDPEGKIEKRFSEYSTYLKDLFCDLYPLYASSLDEAEKTLELDSIKVRKISKYLKYKSVEILETCDGDAKKAFNFLVSFLLDKISVASVSYDEGAVKFYIIKQITQCNVFPGDDK